MAYQFFNNMSSHHTGTNEGFSRLSGSKSKRKIRLITSRKRRLSKSIMISALQSQLTQAGFLHVKKTPSSILHLVLLNTTQLYLLSVSTPPVEWTGLTFKCRRPYRSNTTCYSFRYLMTFILRSLEEGKRYLKSSYYKSFVRSILDYASYIYFTSAIVLQDKIEAIHYATVQAAPGYRMSTPNNILFGEARLTTIFIRAEFLCNCYFTKIYSNSSSSSRKG